MLFFCGNNRYWILDTYFAVTAPGLKQFTIQELLTLDLLPVTALAKVAKGATSTRQSDEDEQSLDFPGGTLPAESGGVTFKGDLAALYRANLHLRTTSRILARLGNFFHATTFPDLQKRVSRLPWERFLSPGQPISLRVTCHNSKLYHSQAVARSVSAGLAERLGRISPLVKAEQQMDGHPPQLIIVRLSADKCTVSVDASGELLHKRGYRQAIAKAPLRETLAAALLMASAWDRSGPLMDPFCGSGTIPIEAALMALGIPPGMHRQFAFMDWPNFDQQLWLSIMGQMSTAPSTMNPIILASDRDTGAIEMAYENARRAGVEKAIEFKCQAVSAITPPPFSGWVVTNPPYGLRISEGKDLRNLYAQFGNTLRKHCIGWQVALLCNDPVLLGQMHMKLDTSLGFVNGGIPVRVARGKVG